jgi:hypothetical protein
MKKIILILITGSFLMSCGKSSEKKEADTGHEMHHQKGSSAGGYIDSLNTGLIKEDTLKGSPSRVVMNTVGNAHLHITYHSPGVKGRVIWGGLVPYDQVWVTGAHDATSLQIINPVMIDGRKIESGTYAIFTIPGKQEWVFILNKNYKQHLADDYKAAEDVLRVKVSPLISPMTQRLAYAISATSDSTGIISMSWEKLKIEVPFSTIK